MIVMVIETEQSRKEVHYTALALGIVMGSERRGRGFRRIEVRVLVICDEPHVVGCEASFMEFVYRLLRISYV
jgi:hypothetical protein